MNNPYTLTFGKDPEERISRALDGKEILNDFLAERPSQQVCLITGVKGSGKTVFMTDLCNELQKRKEWVIVDLNVNSPDMIRQAAAILCSNDKFARVFQSAKLNFSLFGFGLEVSSSVPIADIQTALEKMIENLARKGKKIVFSIDEVTKTEAMITFASCFQQMLRKKLPVFLLMTGLYQNIYDLQNHKSLTFLYRAPRVSLSPLNLGAIASNYQSNLNLPADTAREMAKLTMGYSFAFQVLGYLLWNMEGDYSDLIPQYRQYLEERSYEKIWAELSEKDRKLVVAIAKIEDGNIEGIRAAANMTSNEFSPYRIRLIRKGIVDGSRRGYLRFCLPFFGEYVLDNFAA